MDTTSSKDKGPGEDSAAQAGNIFRRAGLTGAEELRRVGNALLALADALAPIDEYVRSPLPIDDTLTEEKLLGDLANGIYAARRRRTKFFSPDIFAEPAWDMLLDLFANSARHRRITVSSLCLAAAVPPSTSLRWIGILVSHGLVERIPLQRDQRATEVRLTAKGFAAVRECLHDWLGLPGQ
jgi:hypothetical protein